MRKSDSVTREEGLRDLQAVPEPHWHIDVNHAHKGPLGHVDQPAIGDSLEKSGRIVESAVQQSRGEISRMIFEHWLRPCRWPAPGQLSSRSWPWPLFSHGRGSAVCRLFNRHR